MKFVSTVLLVAFSCVSSPLFAEPQEVKTEVSSIEAGAAVLTLRFDGKVITFSGKTDCEIIETTIKKVIERRGINGLRMEYGCKTGSVSFQSVPLVGEKKANYYRFLHAEEGVAVSASEDQGEAIRVALKVFGIETQTGGGDK